MQGVMSVLVYPPSLCASLTARLGARFCCTPAISMAACVAQAAQVEPKLIMVREAAPGSDIAELCKALQDNELTADIPVIALALTDDAVSRLHAFEVGCDDYLLEGVSNEELSARVSRSIFNKIANEQLKSRVMQAHQLAFSAMASTSILGVNIQFLLDSAQAGNLDELGQLYFRAIKHYGLSCSLQLRSEYGVKNMEENGMAKDLESQLLTSLKDQGRFYDFGRRTIINYGQASILVKNMPLDDTTRYGEIRDNIFALVQGLDARIKALDAVKKAEQEKALVEKLAFGIKCTMETADASFHTTMRRIANVVEDMADQLSSAIPAMSLSEAQEKRLERIVEKAIGDTQQVFHDGLKVDEQFVMLVDAINRLFANGDHFDARALNEISRQL